MEHGSATEDGCCVGSVKAYTVHKGLSIFPGSEISNDIDSYGSRIYDVRKVTEVSVPHRWGRRWSTLFQLCFQPRSTSIAKNVSNIGLC